MGKWKDSTVNIVQVFQGFYNDWLFGLGDDQKLYRWDYDHSAWKKYWKETDQPNG